MNTVNLHTMHSRTVINAAAGDDDLSDGGGGNGSDEGISDTEMIDDQKHNWSGGSQCSPNSNASQGSGGHGGGGGYSTVADSAAVVTASDAEGVWSPDIEQAFQEALTIYPPCGRRKIILSDEGRMYGRNELIARYIKLRTGKTRSRKQVSSHIQVLARKKARELQAKLKDHHAKKQAMNSLSNMSSAQIVNLHNKAVNAAAAAAAAATVGIPLFNPVTANLWPGSPGSGFSPPTASTTTTPIPAAAVPSNNNHQVDVKVFSPFQMNNNNNNSNPQASATTSSLIRFPQGIQLPLKNAHSNASSNVPAWEGRSLCTEKIRLCDFSAYCLPNPSVSTKRHEMVLIDSNVVTHSDPLLEHVDIAQIYEKFPTAGKDGLPDLYSRCPGGCFLVKFWADINFKCPDEQVAMFAVDSRYESGDNFTISVSTKVCSFGKQVVEKVEHEYPKFESGRFVYRIQKSPMCEYMNNFIHKLKKLPERHLMNSVLENFTILQLVTNKDTQDLLLCIAFVFEVSDEDGPQNRMYKLKCVSAGN